MDIFIKKTADDDKREFAPSFLRLFLPINEWVLTELIDDWKLECEKKVNPETFVEFKKLSISFLQKIGKDTAYDATWVEAIIYISLHLMSRSMPPGDRIPWIRDISNTSTPAVEANLFVAAKIQELYEKWSKVDDRNGDKLAQPFAFYLLVSSVSKDENFIKAIRAAKKDMALLDDYLGCRSSGSTNFEDRLSLFAADFYKNGNKIISENNQKELNTIDHFELMNISKAKIDRIVTDGNPINILAMGIPGSGKSTIIKMIDHVLGAPKNNRIKTSTFSLPITALSVVEDEDGANTEGANFFGPLSDRTKATISDIKDFPGRIKIGDTQYPMSFIDIKGGLLVETPLRHIPKILKEDIKKPLEKLLTETDLLLVILDPETMFYKDNTELTFENIIRNVVTRLDYLFHTSQHAMIALVFAKSDEYGAVIKGPRNLIHNDSQIKCLANFMANNTEVNWEALTKEITKSYLLYGENTSLKQIISQLLERIKYLLTSICSTRKYPVINCYIASSAIMKDIENSLWTGYPEIFNDFATYMDWLIKKKESQKFSAPVSVSAGITEDFKVELKWQNPNKRPLLTRILKKNDSDDFVVIGRAMSIEPGSARNYIDNSVDHNDACSYKIEFIDNLEDQNSSGYSPVININIPPKPSPVILPPTNFQSRYIAKTGRVVLEWNNENEFDVINRLERRGEENEFKLLYEGPQGGSSESYLDVNIDSGKTYFYRILCLEKEYNDNASRPAESGSVRTPPNGVKSVHCEVKPNIDEPDCIEVSWQEAKNEFETEYIILRRVTDSNGHKPFEVIADQFKNNLYRDTNIRRAHKYQYQVITFETFTKLESLPVNSERVNIKSRAIGPIIIFAVLVLVLICILYYVFGG